MFSLIVYSAIPPGTIGLVDKMKDTDNDGLNDFEELALNLDPSDEILTVMELMILVIHVQIQLVE